METKTPALTDKTSTPVVTVITEAKLSKPYGRVTKSREVWIRHRDFGFMPFRNPEGGTANKIGSSFSSKGQDVLRGLTPEEEYKYLPDIIGTRVESDQWTKDARAYWANISRVVPPSTKDVNGEMIGGLKLEVGRVYKSQEDEDFDAACLDETQKKGEPISVIDYILWRYCLVYNRVANTIDVVGDSPKIDFYLYSREQEIAAKKTTGAIKKASRQLFYKQMTDRAWVDWLLRVFIAGDDKAKIFIKDLDKSSNDEKDIILEEYADSQPENFVRFGTDASLEMRSFIELAIAKNRLSRLPNTDTIQMGDLTLGNTVNEVIAFLANEKNSKIKDALKAQVNVTP